MSSCSIGIYVDKNENGKADAGEPSWHWHQEWPQGSESKVSLRLAKKTIDPPIKPGEATFRYTIEISNTTGGTHKSRGIIVEKEQQVSSQ